MLQSPGASDLVGERLHQVAAVVEPRQVVGEGPVLELATPVPQPRHHVVEHFGQRADLAATHHREIDGEVAGRHLGRAGRQPIERAHDQHAQQVREQADAEQQGGDDQHGQISQPDDLAVGRLRRDLGHDSPPQSRHALQRPHDLLPVEPQVALRAASSVGQQPHALRWQLDGHRRRAARTGAGEQRAVSRHDDNAAEPVRGEASDDLLHRAQVQLCRQRTDEASVRRVDGNGHDHLRLARDVVAIGLADEGVIRLDRVEPVRGQRHGPGVASARRHYSGARIEHDELIVVGEAIPDRVEVVAQAAVRPTLAHGLPPGQGDFLEILGNLVGAREHPEIVEPLLQPQVELAGRLRAQALLFARDLFGERSLTVRVRHPGGRERGNEGGQHRKREQLVADALQPQGPEAMRDGLLPGAHSILGTRARRPVSRLAPAERNRRAYRRVAPFGKARPRDFSPL